MIVLNLKNYAESTGKNLNILLDSLKKLVTDFPEYKDKIIVAPSMVHLIDAKKNYPELNIISQHVDSKGQGSTTGWIPAEVLLSNGLNTVILNHSEHRVLPEDYVNELHEKGMKIIACCENVEEAKMFIEKKVFAVAFEPKDLIGSGISVTTRPDAVKEFVEVAKGKTLVLIGAGVSTKEDVLNGVKLGAEGALLASAFVKAADPYQVAKDLVEGLG